MQIRSNKQLLLFRTHGEQINWFNFLLSAALTVFDEWITGLCWPVSSNPLLIGVQRLYRAVNNVNPAKRRRWLNCLSCLHATFQFHRNKLTCIADVEWAPDMIGNTGDVFAMQIGLTVVWMTSAWKAHQDHCRHYAVRLMSWRASQLHASRDSRIIFNPENPREFLHKSREISGFQMCYFWMKYTQFVRFLVSRLALVTILRVSEYQRWL